MNPARVTPDLLALANRLVDASGPILRRYFRAAIDVDTKTDESPVTRADRETEQALRAIIESERPGDGFFGEETGAKASRNGFTWVIDPIDGTRAFICGKPLFGTLIALLHEDVPVLGVIDQPVLNERWLGAIGQPTTMNGAPIRTSACQSIREAKINTTSPTAFDRDKDLAAFYHLAAHTRTDNYGGDCYAYGLVALGTLDIVAEANLKLYDYAAIIPVIEGAGGVVTGWRGQKPGRDHDGTILAAANPVLHRAALALLNEPGC